MTKPKKKRRHVELFAGCGGLSIGLKKSGFELEFASEVSPMASATFAHNLLGVDISSQTDKVLWLHSRYSNENLALRMKENLLSHNTDENTEVEFSENLSTINGKLLIGDVRRLKEQLLNARIKNPYNGELDLLSGGPPCQSFSLAGRREMNNYKNSLPLDFAEVTRILNPKVVLLENVKGILSPFTSEGIKYYAWFEVAKAFAMNGWAPVCMLINSKYFGVPQNRPRYIMFGLRKDIFRKLKRIAGSHVVVQNLANFMNMIKTGPENVQISDLNYYDLERHSDLFDGFILPKPTSVNPESWISVRDAIDDLTTKNNVSEYVSSLNSASPKGQKGGAEVPNHQPRRHSDEIQNRFKFYQILNHCPDTKLRILKAKYEGRDIPESLIQASFNELKHSAINLPEEISRLNDWSIFLRGIQLTKKHSQRALIENEPSPAQLTIPDDMCHYSLDQTRVLTVREMARIQSFPDWFEFKSKPTTGGKNRSFEVPQYTQVGNAVPPNLATLLGAFIDQLLTRINS
jgi:DNA (cytosine-5)-methyltransferase 1